ncbi:MAG: right-handed parallel beta-helix repeat-containing protein [Rikenellaceae bacterium]
MKFKFPTLLFALLMVSVQGVISSNKIVDVPINSTASQISAIINNAVANSSNEQTTEIRFAKKATYELSSSNPDASIIRISNFKGKQPNNIIIDGQGAEFIITSYNKFCTINNARNVTFKNFSLDYELRQISKGTIVGFKSDNSSVVDIEIERNAPLPDIPTYADAKLKWLIPVEQDESGEWIMSAAMPSTIGYARVPATRIKGRVYRFWLRSSIDHGRIMGCFGEDLLLGNLKVGQKMAIIARTNGYGSFYILNSTNTKLESITINHSPASIVADINCTNSSYINVDVHPAEGEWFTATADGIYVADHRDGPTIENCTIRGIGDDAVVLKNTVLLPKGRSTNQKLPFVLAGGAKSGNQARIKTMVGDTIVFYDFAKRKILSTHVITATNSTEQSMPSIMVDATPAIPESYAKNSDVWGYNCSNQCNNFVIRGCTFADNRRWGVLCSGANGVIENNKFIRSQASAINIVNSDNYEYNMTGAIPRNITIRGNLFEQNYHSAYGDLHSVISSGLNGLLEQVRSGKLPPAEQNIKSITIEGNTFRNWYQQVEQIQRTDDTQLVTIPIRAIELKDTTGVVIKDNTFELDGCQPNLSEQIVVENCSDVNISGNTSK